MNATVLVLKATHHKTTVQDSPSVLGWQEEDIRKREKEEFWRFDVNVFIENVSEKSALIMIKRVCLSGKGMAQAWLSSWGSKLLAEVLMPGGIPGIEGAYNYSKYSGVPGPNMSFGPRSKIEMELSFGLWSPSFYIPGITNYDEYFGEPIPLTLIVYMKCMGSGIMGRTRVYEEEVTTNFIGYPKDGIITPTPTKTSTFHETEDELTEEQKPYKDLIELFRTDNGKFVAECSNVGCKYQYEGILGISGRPERGFFVPGYCEHCKVVTSISSKSRECELCGRDAKRYPLDENFIKGQDYYPPSLARNLVCPKCSQSTLDLDVTLGNWD